jgi:hypothetical protein
MKRSVLVLLAVLATLLTWAPAASAETRTVSYGPFTIPAGTMDDPGMINNKLQFAVKRPCSDCYITRFTPDLIDAKTGQSTNMDDGPMLHHAVWTSQWRSDATCGGTWLGLAGQRFFASGNERSVVDFPYGYGYRVRWYDSWNMLVDLMNHSTSAKTVYVRLTVETRPSWASVQSVRPVWLDIDQCGDSEYDIPDIADTGGFSDKHRDWTVNVPGKVVSAVGHVHGHGVAVEATNESALPPYSICRSEATPGMDAHEIASMSTCVGAPSLGTIKSGETVRLHSLYSAMHPLEDVMGIMLMYVRPQ